MPPTPVLASTRSLLRVVLVAAGLAAAVSAQAQQPRLVLDINQAGFPGPGHEVDELGATSDAVYFAGFASLWRVGPSLAPTLLASSTGAGWDDMEAVGSVLFLSSNMAGSGLFRTDGTPGGTRAVPGAPEHPRELTDVAGTLFFIANSGPSQAVQLWKADGQGTAATVVATLPAEELIAAGSRLFFVHSSLQTGYELWTSDGTAAGTHLVRDVCPGGCSGFEYGTPMAAVGSSVYFAGFDLVHGTELWRSDGTVAGTVMVAELSPDDSHLYGLTAFGSLLLFATRDDVDVLWRSNGTAAGTFALRSGLEVRTLHATPGRAYLEASDAASGAELWTTDGTVGGTARLTDGCPGPCDFLQTVAFGTAGSGVVFGPVGASGLWRSDGTPAGTALVRDFVDLRVAFAPFGGAAYFAADDGTHGLEVWRTDGSAANTVLAADAIDYDSSPTPIGSVGDRFFFSARRPDTGVELWTSTGSTASTTLLELSPGPGDAGLSGPAAALGSQLLFAAQPGGPATSHQLWRSDGLPSGTAPIAHLAVGSNPTTRAGIAYFGGGVIPFALEPWRTDGTPTGTAPVADILPGPAGSLPSGLVSLPDAVVFTVERDAGGLQYTPWRTDGTAEGTMRLSSLPCFRVTQVGARAFMDCVDSATTGGELWVTEGTPATTRLVKDIEPGPGGIQMRELADVDGTLYFSALTSGTDLWKSDGTAAGTVEVQDGSLPIVSSPRALTASNGLLFFVGSSDAGEELWRSDGTNAGTFMLRDIAPGPESGVVLNELAAVAGGVVFAGTTQAGGTELWFSDGTTNGTVPLPEIEPGPTSAYPRRPRTVGPRVYFSAFQVPIGDELWAVDFPASVTVGDASVVETDAGTVTLDFLVTLSTPAAVPVTVGYATVPGTATAGTDFQPRSGTVTFPAGTVGPQTIPIPVLGDFQDEPTETFTLQLSGITGASAQDTRAQGAIVDDDGPSLAASGATVTEGDAGTTAASFVLTLTTADGQPTSQPTLVRYATEGATATSGVDFDAQAGVLTFPAGSASGASAAVQVPVRGDTVDEADEQFRVRLEPMDDESIDLTLATGVIEDDDGVAALSAVELSRGSILRAALAPPAGRSTDRDWYVVMQEPYSSYEVVVDETSGDAAPLEVLRVRGASVLQSASAVGTGGARSLRWQNTTADRIADEHLTVSSTACGTACAEDDRYRLRFYETSLAAARYNYANGQVTVVILQNASDDVVSGRVHFWVSGAGLALTRPFTIPPRGMTVVDTGGLQLVAGSLTVTHDGSYGTLVGKAVALEPATGFSFDTPLVARPR
jgi:ELWxxDGT repeat protein